MASSYSNLHPVDQILTSLVNEAIPADSQLIAGDIFENIKVPERSGTFLQENTRNFMGSPELDLERAPGASRVSIGGFDRSSTTFKAKIYAAKDSIAMEDILDSQYPGGEEARIAKKVRRTMMLAKEKRAADLLFSTSVFTNNDNCTSVMGGQINAAGTDALTGLDKLKDLVFANAHGINPDTLVMGRGVARALARNPEFRSYLTVGANPSGIAAGGSMVLSNEAVAQIIKDILNIPNVYVGSARRETAVPGATSSEAQIWTDDVIFCGILRGSDAISQKSGNVKGMPVAALNFDYGSMVAGQYDSLDSVKRYVYAEEVHTFQAIDVSLGYLVTSCLA
jgi:hypothetical protein